MDYLTAIIIYYIGFLLWFLLLIILKLKKHWTVEGVGGCTMAIFCFFWPLTISFVATIAIREIQSTKKLYKREFHK